MSRRPEKPLRRRELLKRARARREDRKALDNMNVGGVPLQALIDRDVQRRGSGR